MLRPVIRARIEEMLQSNPFFSVHEFTIEVLPDTSSTIASEHGDDGTVVEIKIAPSAMPEFYLHAEILREKERIGGALDHVFRCEVSPGDFGYAQVVKVANLSGLRSVIDPWLARMREDIVLLPSARARQEQYRQIERVVQKYTDAKETYFSPQQITQWQLRLDAIEARLSAAISHAPTDGLERAEQVTRLRSEITGLKIKLDAFDQKSWFRSFMGWFFKLTTTPVGKQLTASGVEVALSLLTESQLSLSTPVPNPVSPTPDQLPDAS